MSTFSRNLNNHWKWREQAENFHPAKFSLPIALTQVKSGNTSENLLNEIRKIIYSLYRAKEITKKVYKYISI